MARRRDRLRSPPGRRRVPRAGALAGALWWPAGTAARRRDPARAVGLRLRRLRGAPGDRPTRRATRRRRRAPTASPGHSARTPAISALVGPARARRTTVGGFTAWKCLTVLGDHRRGLGTAGRRRGCCAARRTPGAGSCCWPAARPAAAPPPRRSPASPPAWSSPCRVDRADRRGRGTLVEVGIATVARPLLRARPAVGRRRCSSPSARSPASSPPPGVRRRPTPAPSSARATRCAWWPTPEPASTGCAGPPRSAGSRSCGRSPPRTPVACCPSPPYRRVRRPDRRSGRPARPRRRHAARPQHGGRTRACSLGSPFGLALRLAAAPFSGGAWRSSPSVCWSAWSPRRRAGDHRLAGHQGPSRASAHRARAPRPISGWPS